MRRTRRLEEVKLASDTGRRRDVAVVKAVAAALESVSGEPLQTRPEIIKICLRIKLAADGRGGRDGRERDGGSV